MNVDVIKDALSNFARAHRTALSLIAQRESQLLELGAIVAVELHYRSNGYYTLICSPKGTASFVVKTNTRGHPAKYSHIRIEKDGEVREAHMNLLVKGAHDEGIYCVDVGIVRPGIVPVKAERKQKWAGVPNEDVLSLVEVKRLVVYPMLLAQFIGIVHEIRPEFLRAPTPAGFGRYSELPPTLIALGNFSGNSRVIVTGYGARSICLCIAENFDMRLAAHRKGTAKSPLYWDKETDLEATPIGSEQESQPLLAE